LSVKNIAEVLSKSRCLLLYNQLQDQALVLYKNPFSGACPVVQAACGTSRATDGASPALELPELCKLLQLIGWYLGGRRRESFLIGTSPSGTPLTFTGYLL